MEGNSISCTSAVYLFAKYIFQLKHSLKYIFLNIHFKNIRLMNLSEIAFVQIRDDSGKSHLFHYRSEERSLSYIFFDWAEIVYELHK